MNAAGRVMGMDTAASVDFEFQSSHEGCAIPINRALTLAKQIVAGRASTTVHIGSTPFLGVSVAAGGSSTGALVAAVVSGSPAEQAGIVAGDTITAVTDSRSPPTTSSRRSCSSTTPAPPSRCNGSTAPARRRPRTS